MLSWETARGQVREGSAAARDAGIALIAANVSSHPALSTSSRPSSPSPPPRPSSPSPTPCPSSPRRPDVPDGFAVGEAGAVLDASAPPTSPTSPIVSAVAATRSRASSPTARSRPRCRCLLVVHHAHVAPVARLARRRPRRRRRSRRPSRASRASRSPLRRERRLGSARVAGRRQVHLDIAQVQLSRSSSVIETRHRHSLQSSRSVRVGTRCAGDPGLPGAPIISALSLRPCLWEALLARTDGARNRRSSSCLPGGTRVYGQNLMRPSDLACEGSRHRS